jgi:transcriptional/translational regulatory protein YebC/TACO1
VKYVNIDLSNKLNYINALRYIMINMCIITTFTHKDFLTEEEGYEVVTAPEDFNTVRDELKSKGYDFLSADIKLIPQTTSQLSEEGQVKAMDKLIEMLEEDDDVQDIYTTGKWNSSRQKLKYQHLYLYSIC